MTQVGDIFGKWTVIGYERARKGGPPWLCRCECGSEGYRAPNIMRKFPFCQKCRVYDMSAARTALAASRPPAPLVRPSRAKKHIAPRGVDLIGRKFGSLVVIARHDMTKSGSLWACRCDCGSEETVFRITSNLRRGGNVGCKNCEPLRRALIHITHGGAFGGRSRLYSVWKGMLSRCRDEKNIHYGAKGITVCPRWQDFPAFRAWAHENGYANGLSIDRMNPNKGYSPDNCEWVTRSENSRRVHAPKIVEAMAA